MPVYAVTLNKSFSPISINPGNTSLVTIQVFNDQLVALTNTAWSDTLPLGMTVLSSPLPTTSCGGTVTATAGTRLISFSGGTVPAKVGPTFGQCDVVVPVTGAGNPTVTNYVNTIPSSNLTNTQGFTNSAAASATLQVAAFLSPSISTTLNPSTIYLGQQATYVITLTNTDPNSSLTLAGWSKTLPTGLEVGVGPPTVSSTGCGSPTITATAGSTTIALSNATVIKSSTCTVTIPVTGNAQGNYTINLPAGIVTNAQGVTNGTADNQAIAVQSFSVSKSFAPAAVKTNQISVMTVTISTVAAYNNLAFTDNFSSQTGLVVAPTPGASTTCGSGSVTAVAGSQSISLSGGSITAGTFVSPQTCTVSVNVVVPSPANIGTKTNTINAYPAVGSISGTSAIGSIAAGNINAASANLVVTGYTAPTFTVKSFSNTTPFVGQPLTLTITVRNNDATNALTNVGWTDTLPTGLQVATGSTTTSAGCTGTPVVTAPVGVDAGTISLSGATIAAANTTCTVTVPVVANRQGTFTNTAIPAGNITNNQNTSNTAASPSATLTASTFTAVKKLNGSSPTANMNTGTATKMRFEFINKSTDSYHNLSFSDNFTSAPSTLPATFTVASPTNAVTTCNPSGTPTAIAGITSGATSISFSGGTLAAGSSGNVTVTCYVELDVTASAAITSKINAVPGGITALADGSGVLTAGLNTAASATVANLTISAAALVAPTISAKTFSVSPIVVGSGTSNLAITVKNNDLTTTLTNVTWTDNFPAGLVWTGGTITYTGCGTGTVTFNPGNNIATLGGGVSLAPSGTCLATIPVKTTSQDTFTNQIAIGAIGNTQGASNTAASPAPTLTSTSLTAVKAFRNAGDTATVTDINVGDTVKLKVTITNPSTTESYNSLSFTDSFANFTATVGGGPALQIAATPNAQTTCVSGGALTSLSSLAGSAAVANSQSVTLASGILAANSSCYVIVDVTAIAAMTAKTNTIVAGSKAGVAGEINALSNSNSTKVWKAATTTANLTIGTITAPTFTAKTFGTSPIYFGQNSTLTISIKNNDATATLNGVHWVDTLPLGLIANGAATVPAACGSPTGTVSVDGTSRIITFSNGIVAAGATCTITIPVTATATGTYTNQITTGIDSTELGNSPGSSPAPSITTKSLEISKSFSASPIAVGATTTLTINITNNTTTAYSNIGLIDDLSTMTGVVVAATPAIQNLGGTGCTVGSVTATPGDNKITLSGFSLAAGAVAAQKICTVKVNVVGNISGVKTNTIPINGFTTTTPSTQNVAAATASFTVSSATITVTKSFTPTTILADGTTSSILHIGITNNNNTALSSVAFTDNLATMSAGLLIANSPLATSTCNGSLTATAGTALITLGSGTIVANGSCTIDVPVVSTAFFNARNNTVSVSALTAGGESVSNSGSASLTSNMLSVTKSFANPNILITGKTQMTITVTNNSTTAQTGVVFTDNFPLNVGSGYIVIASPANVVKTCNGAVTAVPGANSISLGSSTLAANSSCSVTVDVLGSIATGSRANTVSASSTQQTTAVTGSSNFTVVNPSISINTVNKSFSPTSVDILTDSRATITWSSSSPGTTVNPILTDNLPANLTVSTNPAVSATCTSAPNSILSTTISPARDQIIVALSVNQASGTSCSVSFNVTPSGTVGTWTNTIVAGNITSADGTTAVNTVGASAPLTVTTVASVTLAKAFQPTTVGAAGTSLLTITITNPENIPLTGVSLTDSLPNGTAPNSLLIASPSNATTNCTADGSPDASKVTAVAGTRNIVLTGGVIPPKVGAVNGQCTITVSVKPAGLYTSGSATNTINALVLSSNELRTNSNSATASLSFSAPSLNINKDFSPTLVTGGSVSRLTVTISNPEAYPQTGLAFTDTMPAGMTVGLPPNPSTTCTGGTFTNATLGSGTWSFSGGSVPASSSCTVSLNATSTVDGNLINTIPIGNVSTGAGVTSTNGGANGAAASATLSNLPGANFGKSFSPNPSTVNQAIRLTISITNSSSVAAISGMAFTDDLTLGSTQTGLTVAGTPAITNTCGGSVSTTSTSISLTGGALATQATCQIAVNLVTNTAKTYTNTIPAGALSTNETVTNANPSTDVLPVYASIKAIKQLSPTSDGGRFVLTLSPAAPTGVSSRTNVGHDATPSSVTAFSANQGTTYTLTETGQGLTDLADYTTTHQCVDADGTIVAGTSGSGTSVSVTPPTTAGGATKNQQEITCTFTNSNAQDHGDAPTSYGDASHAVPILTTVYLGNVKPDGDVNADVTTWQSQTTASGDETTGTADESISQIQFNGLSVFPTLSTTDTSYSLTLRCSGTTTANAVSGWIDFNKNNSFDVGERAQGTCSSSGSGTVTLSWSSLSGLTTGNTYARFRIASSASESGNATGVATDGETEDYVVTIGNVAAITGKVFKDTGTGGGTANNGIQEGGETGIAQVTVKLTNCSSTVYTTTTTDGSGNYSLPIAGVSPGNVCVEELNLSGYSSTGNNVAGNTASPNGIYTLPTADKISFTFATNTNYSNINFADVPPNQFVTDGAKTGLPGTTLVYTHTFTAATTGSVTFSTTAIPSPTLTGWNETLYQEDSNCNGVLDGTEATTILTTVAVTEGQKVCLIDKEFIPATAALGSSNQVTVQAVFDYTGTLPNATYTRQDLTTVSDSALILDKKVNNFTTTPSPIESDWKVSNAAKKNDILEYRITYTNNGTKPISNLIVNDATPAFTTFVSALSGAFPANLTACQKVTPSSGGSVSCATADVATGTGGINWTFTGALQPGASGTVTFRVKLD